MPLGVCFASLKSVIEEVICITKVRKYDEEI